MKGRFIVLASVLIFNGCVMKSNLPTEQKEVQDGLGELLTTIPAAQPKPRPQPEGIEIPRLAPWLGDRLAAQYQDDAKSAIKTVLQGRPVFFELKREENPPVTSPVDASTVMGHLDAIMVQADWSYSVDRGVVVVTDTETRQFPIQATPGFRSGRLGLSGSNSGGAENSMSINNLPYRDLEASVQSAARDYMMEEQNSNQAGRSSSSNNAADGEMYTFLPSSNTLTVSGPPSFVRRVETIVNDFNESVTRKVHLVITVYDVEFNSSSQRSIDFDLLRDAAIASSISMNGSSLVQSTAGGLRLGLDFFEGNAFDSSRLVFNLLRQQGQTTVKIHEAFEATNNVIFSIENQRITPYISQVSTDRQDGGSISSLTPTIQTQEVNTGMGFHVVATIAGDNIGVQLSLKQSDLVRFDPYNFGSGDSGISGSLPVTDVEDRVIPMTLKDGETRLIANLTQAQFRSDDAGSGFGIFGRSRAENGSEKQTVIAVSAKIL